ncbi:hypothetical protein DIPPA_26608 [Diplonema papillatum]|nr:hypothetical protein DIPPA_26608 [Diplonema papillatum]
MPLPPRVLSLLLLGVCASLLVGRAGAEDGAGAAVTVALLFAAPGPADKARNEQVNVGLVRASRLLFEQGVDVRTTAAEAPLGDTGAAAALLGRFCAENYTHIVSCSPFFEATVRQLAQTCRSSNFVQLFGQGTSLENLAVVHPKEYQVKYLAGYVAGAFTKTQKVGYIATLPDTEAATTRSLVAFTKGVFEGNIEAAMHVAWVRKTDKVAWAINRLTQVGCDVVTGNHDDLDAYTAATRELISVIGHSADLRLRFGDAVLTSTSLDWAPYFTQLLNSTGGEPNPTQPGTFEFPGLASGIPILHALSPRVDAPAAAAVAAKRRALLAADAGGGGDEVFCGEIVEGSGLPTDGAGCLSDAAVWGSAFPPFSARPGGVVDLGVVDLPEAACPSGTRWEFAAGAFACTPCAAGSFANVSAEACSPCPPGTYQPSTGQAGCIDCAAGSFAGVEGSTACEDCPTGTVSSRAGQPACEECPADTYVGAGAALCEPDPSLVPVVLLAFVACAVVIAAFAAVVAIWVRSSAGRSQAFRAYASSVVAVAEWRLDFLTQLHERGNQDAFAEADDLHASEYFTDALTTRGPSDTISIPPEPAHHLPRRLLPGIVRSWLNLAVILQCYKPYLPTAVTNEELSSGHGRPVPIVKGKGRRALGTVTDTTFQPAGLLRLVKSRTRLGLSRVSTKVVIAYVVPRRKRPMFKLETFTANVCKALQLCRANILRVTADGVVAAFGTPKDYSASVDSCLPTLSSLAEDHCVSAVLDYAVAGNIGCNMFRTFQALQYPSDLGKKLAKVSTVLTGGIVVNRSFIDRFREKVAHRPAGRVQLGYADAMCYLVTEVYALRRGADAWAYGVTNPAAQIAEAFFEGKADHAEMVRRQPSTLADPLVSIISGLPAMRFGLVYVWNGARLEVKRQPCVEEADDPLPLSESAMRAICARAHYCGAPCPVGSGTTSNGTCPFCMQMSAASPRDPARLPSPIPHGSAQLSDAAVSVDTRAAFHAKTSASDLTRSSSGSKASTDGTADGGVPPRNPLSAPSLSYLSWLDPTDTIPTATLHSLHNPLTGKPVPASAAGAGPLPKVQRFDAPPAADVATQQQVEQQQAVVPAASPPRKPVATSSAYADAAPPESDNRSHPSTTPEPSVSSGGALDTQKCLRPPGSERTPSTSAGVSGSSTTPDGESGTVETQRFLGRADVRTPPYTASSQSLSGGTPRAGPVTGVTASDSDKKRSHGSTPESEHDSFPSAGTPPAHQSGSSSTNQRAAGTTATTSSHTDPPPEPSQPPRDQRRGSAGSQKADTLPRRSVPAPRKNPSSLPDSAHQHHHHHHHHHRGIAERAACGSPPRVDGTATAKASPPRSSREALAEGSSWPGAAGPDAREETPGVKYSSSDDAKHSNGGDEEPRRSRRADDGGPEPARHRRRSVDEPPRHGGSGTAGDPPRGEGGGEARGRSAAAREGGVWRTRSGGEKARKRRESADEAFERPRHAAARGVGGSRRSSGDGRESSGEKARDRREGSAEKSRRARRGSGDEAFERPRNASTRDAGGSRRSSGDGRESSGEKVRNRREGSAEKPRRPRRESGDEAFERPRNASTREVGGSRGPGGYRDGESAGNPAPREGSAEDPRKRRGSGGVDAPTLRRDGSGGENPRKRREMEPAGEGAGGGEAFEPPRNASKGEPGGRRRNSGGGDPSRESGDEAFERPRNASTRDAGGSRRSSGDGRESSGEKARDRREGSAEKPRRPRRESGDQAFERPRNASTREVGGRRRSSADVRESSGEKTRNRREGSAEMPRKRRGSDDDAFERHRNASARSSGDRRESEGEPPTRPRSTAAREGSAEKPRKRRESDDDAFERSRNASTSARDVGGRRRSSGDGRESSGENARDRREGNAEKPRKRRGSDDDAVDRPRNASTRDAGGSRRSSGGDGRETGNEKARTRREGSAENPRRVRESDDDAFERHRNASARSSGEPPARPRSTAAREGSAENPRKARESDDAAFERPRRGRSGGDGRETADEKAPAPAAAERTGLGPANRGGGGKPQEKPRRGREGGRQPSGPDREAAQSRAAAPEPERETGDAAGRGGGGRRRSAGDDDKPQNPEKAASSTTTGKKSLSSTGGEGAGGGKTAAAAPATTRGSGGSNRTRTKRASAGEEGAGDEKPETPPAAARAGSGKRRPDRRRGSNGENEGAGDGKPQKTRADQPEPERGSAAAGRAAAATAAATTRGGGGGGKPLNPAGSATTGKKSLSSVTSAGGEGGGGGKPQKNPEKTAGSAKSLPSSTTGKRRGSAEDAAPAAKSDRPLARHPTTGAKPGTPHAATPQAHRADLASRPRPATEPLPGKHPPAESGGSASRSSGDARKRSATGDGPRLPAAAACGEPAGPEEGGRLARSSSAAAFEKRAPAAARRRLGGSGGAEKWKLIADRAADDTAEASAKDPPPGQTLREEIRRQRQQSQKAPAAGQGKPAKASQEQDFALSSFVSSEQAQEGTESPPFSISQADPSLASPAVEWRTPPARDAGREAWLAQKRGKKQAASPPLAPSPLLTVSPLSYSDQKRHSSTFASQDI